MLQNLMGVRHIKRVVFIRQLVYGRLLNNYVRSTRISDRLVGCLEDLISEVDCSDEPLVCPLR